MNVMNLSDDVIAERIGSWLLRMRIGDEGGARYMLTAQIDE